MPAVTFVHVDVVVFFKHTKHVDLSAIEYKDSPTLIAFFKSTYEKVFDYFSILSTVAMPPSSVYDRDACCRVISIWRVCACSISFQEV